MPLTSDVINSGFRGTSVILKLGEPRLFEREQPCIDTAYIQGSMCLELFFIQE